MRKIEVVNRINIMLEGIKGKTNKLEVRFTHDQIVGGKNGWFFFATFIFLIKNF